MQDKKFWKARLHIREDKKTRFSVAVSADFGQGQRKRWLEEMMLELCRENKAVAEWSSSSARSPCSHSTPLANERDETPPIRLGSAFRLVNGEASEPRRLL
ncbi:hypothetical protein SRHO_G00153470 [Serrasalmus rhombeus]